MISKTFIFMLVMPSTLSFLWIPGLQVGLGRVKLKDFTQLSAPLSLTQSVDVLPKLLFFLI